MLRIFRRGVLLVGAIFVFYISGFAQVDVKIDIAEAVPTKENPNHWQIFVGFDTGFDIPTLLRDVEAPSKNPVKDVRNFYLMDIETGQRLSVIYVYFDPTRYYTAGTFNNSGQPGALTLYVDPSVRLDPTHHYHLYVLNVRFDGQATSDPPPQSFIKFADSSASTTVQPEQGDPAKKDSLSFTAADGREDANVYLSGELHGASGTDVSGSVDIKLEYPHRRIIGDRIHNFDPFFELKAAVGPDRDPDTMSFGLNWEWPVWRYRGDNLQAPIRRINWRNAPRIEAERDFENTNFIWESRFRFISRTYASKNATLYFRPFAGQELGANINSPIKEAREKLIYRLLTGTTLNLIFPIQSSGLQDISVEGSYIRRWPFRREVSFEEDDDGNLQTLRIGTRPRDHATVKLNIGFSKSFAGTISYEYGELPPSFKLVDHKMSIGLTYKIKVDR
jgi:hypothetical protein